MLFIDDRQTEILKRNSFLNQCVRADARVCFTGSYRVAESPFVIRFQRADEQFNPVR